MTDLDALEAAYLAAVEAHKTHPPRLRRGRDGIHRCAACDPAGRWERAVDWGFLSRSGRACWWTAGGAVVFGLTVLFQHLGWYA